MSKEKILILVLSGFGAGVAIRSFVELGQFHIIFISFLGLVFFFFYKIRKNLLFLFIGIFIITLSAGVLRYDIKDAKNISAELRPYVGGRAVIYGVVVEEPDERENYTRIIFEAENVLDWDSKKESGLSGDRILITVPRYPQFLYGDSLRVRGKIEHPENFSDFDWEAYLAKDDIYLQMFYPEIKKIGKVRGSLFKQSLFSFKNLYLESIGNVLPEPHASFLGGLTVGARRSMPDELLEDFRKVGVIHIVVLSGYNVTIIARAVASVFKTFLPWTTSIFLGMFGIIAFAVLAGASATVVRASIMAMLIYIAQATGQVYRVSVALFVAGFFMLLHNPKLLRFDTSFQLSFVATLGLIYLAPKLEPVAGFIPKKYKKIREVFLATLSAQIAVTPIILHSMGTFSLSALPVNALILLTVPYAMLFGFFAGVLGIISKILALPFAWAAWVVLAYELKVIDVFARLSFSELSVGYFPLVAVFMLYAVLGCFIFLKKK